MKGSDSGDDGGSRPPFEADRFDPMQQVRAYWEGLRDGDALPQRRQLDPRGIEGALPGVFLVEEVAPGITRFRIAGTLIADLMGMDVRGMPVTALFAPEARPALMQAAGQVFRGPCLMKLDLAGDRAIGRPPLEARLLMLPMTDDNGQCRLALGCLALNGDVGRTPRRFSIARRQLTPLSGAAIAPGPEEPLAGQKADGFAELPVPFAPIRPAPGKPYLRLVRNNG